MAGLSQNELKAIRTHPLRKGLETFRTTFNSKYLKSEDVNLTEIVDQLTSEASDTGEKDIVFDLILAFLSQPAARTLRSRIENGPLSGDIASFYARLSAGQEEAKYVAPLLNFADASEHRRQVDDVLREELLPTLRIDVPDFIPAAFGHIPRLDELAEMVFDRCQEKDTRLYTQGSGWTEWPPSAKEDLVLEWLQDLMKRFVVWTNGVHPAISQQIYKGPSIYLDGSPIKRKMDVGIMGRYTHKDVRVGEKTRPNFNWAQILVAGELKSNLIEEGQEPA